MVTFHSEILIQNKYTSVYRLPTRRNSIADSLVLAETKLTTTGTF